MVTHIVIFFWKPGVTQEQVDAFGQAMSRMAAEIGDLAIRHGQDLAYRDGNGDYALVGTFRDKEAWSAYQAHPAHKAFIRDFVTPILASRTTIQF
jgi:quinol monooxygenase YgiN